MRIRHIPYILLMFIALSFTGVDAASIDDYHKLATIESISSSHNNQDELVIKLSAPTTYTSYKTNAPLRLVIDLSQTTQGAINVPQIINKGNVKTVTASQYDTDAGVLTRVDIELVNDAKPLITATPNNPGELRIQLLPIDTIKQAPPDAPKEILTPATVDVTPPKPDMKASTHKLTGISERDGTIVVGFTGASINYKTTRYGNPERLVLDLADSNSAMATTTIPLQTMGGLTATVGSLPGKVRLIFEPNHGSLPDFAVHVADGQLLITEVGTTEAKPYTAQNPKPVHEEPNTLKLTATRTGVQKKDMPEVVTSQRSAAKTVVFPVIGGSQVEMIDFQRLENLSRISIKVSGDVKTEQPVKGNGFISLTLKNTYLPKRLQRSLETQAFASPVLRVTPMAVTGRNASDTVVKITLKVAAEHSFRREGDMFFVDVMMPQNQIDSVFSMAKNVSATSNQSKYTGKKVSLDFDNAEIRHVFRLLADVSGENFVIGDEVKGLLSIKLKEVPWEQALEIIIRNNNLAMVHHGNVVEIMSNQKKIERDKSENDVKLQESRLKLEQKLANETEEGLETIAIQLKHSTAEKIAKSVQIILSQGDAESGTSQNSSNADTKIKRRFTSMIFPEPNTNKLIVRDYVSRIPRIRKLIEELDVSDNQVLIEARIVEASTSFVQDIGVQWGMHYRDGSASLFGINTLDTAFGGILNTPVAGTSGTFLDPLKGYGVSSGISFGHLASNIQLDMKIAAAVLKGTVKIISTPKIATSYGEQAIIKQGQKIPYQEAAKDGGTSTKFIDAALILDVTPSITPGGDVIMKLLVSNDSPGSGTPPPINTKSATTKLTVKDGETAVIGGIYVDSDLDEDRGIPYLSSLPWIGNLFKSNTKNKVKTEMLIFITPHLLNK